MVQLGRQMSGKFEMIELIRIDTAQSAERFAKLIQSNNTFFLDVNGGVERLSLSNRQSSLWIKE